MTVVSMYQPYFAPFPGFFSKATRSDIFVLLDSVQFPRGTTWITRNRLKGAQGVFWMTIPVRKKGLGLQRINEVKIYHEGKWREKYLTSLKAIYGKAPFFEEHFGFLENVVSKRYERLVDLNTKIILYLMEKMSVSAKTVLLSELGIELKEPRLSVEVCKKLDATRFLAQKSAKKYLSEDSFFKERIELEFFSPRPTMYPQLWGDFIPNLSSLDLIFNCGPKAVKYL